MRQQPMALHARRFAQSQCSSRCATAFRSAAGVTISFPKGSFNPHCPAWRRQQPLQRVGASSTSSAALPPDRPSRRTFAFHLSILSDWRSLTHLAGTERRPKRRPHAPSKSDDLPLRKATALHARASSWARVDLQPCIKIPRATSPQLELLIRRPSLHRLIALAAHDSFSPRSRPGRTSNRTRPRMVLLSPYTLTIFLSHIPPKHCRVRHAVRT